MFNHPTTRASDLGDNCAWAIVTFGRFSKAARDAGKPHELHPFLKMSHFPPPLPSPDLNSKRQTAKPADAAHVRAFWWVNQRDRDLVLRKKFFWYYTFAITVRAVITIDRLTIQ